MLLRRPFPALVAAAVLVGSLTVTTAATADETGLPPAEEPVTAPPEPEPEPVPPPTPPTIDLELPFACGTDWTGSTRRNHSPSVDAVDFNRPGDLGQVVVAAAGGIVSRVADAGARSYGRWIEITHADGYTSLYAHLKSQRVVVGQFVDQGTAIGRVGDTGRVTGAHLHYEQQLAREVQPAFFHGALLPHGETVVSQNCPDVPLAGDWNGDRADEVAVFRRDTRRGTFEMYLQDQQPAPLRFGRSVDLPIVGDWDGDGVTDVGIRRQGRRVFLLRTADGRVSKHRLGLVKDVPVTGDWDGDGTTDLGVYRPRRQLFRLATADGTHRVVRLPGAGAQPVTGDWDGDGRTDVGVFDTATATFRLRMEAADGSATLTALPLGTTTDLPVTGDWNGDGITDVGTWTPGTATYSLRVTPRGGAARYASGAAPELRTVAFGRPRS